jgi:DNA helicase-2/ATP-dependent DNA helicase PcrA
MCRRSVGWRLGTTRVSAGTNDKAILGFAERLNQERGDALWVLSTHANENDARLDEYVTSLEYQIPTVPFVPRPGHPVNGLVHDQQYLDLVFSRIDSEAGAVRLLSDRGFSRERPHHRPRSRNANRRNVTVTLCGDRRGDVPMHRISIAGNDHEGRERLEALGFSVRTDKKESLSWRVESAFKDFGDLRADLDRMRGAFDLVVVFNARFGSSDGESRKASLPFVAADSVMPGMVMFLEDGTYDVVRSTETVVGIEQVYDLNVEHTHNFVANGVVTHNSIYGWRGADPDGMMRFARRPGVELVKLEENYRCTSPILDCANTVIARNKRRLGKTLRANKDGELVRVLLLSSEREEARQVATSIQRPFGHHAVLYRTHAQSRPIEEALRREAIPYTIVGGLRFYDRAEVKDVLAFFRLAVNPRADMDLLRVANKPSRGMGAKKMGALKTAATKKGVTMYEALKDLQDEEKAQGLYNLLRDLAGARYSSLGLLEFLDAVMRLTGYKAALVRTAKESRSVVQREKAQQQIENVHELASDVATYAGDNPGATVEDYVEHVSLVSSFDKDSGPTVSLMTIHAAKGLEFEHVHLVGFEENLLPHANSVKAVRERGLYDEIEEERRLTYVAITRAKTRLDITLVKMRTKAGKVERAVPSRFLAELPEGRHRKLGFKTSYP